MLSFELLTNCLKRGNVCRQNMLRDRIVFARLHTLTVYTIS